MFVYIIREKMYQRVVMKLLFIILVSFSCLILSYFFNFDFIQNTILLLAAFITWWIYYDSKIKDISKAATILALQIKDIEKNIEYLFSEGLINGAIQERPIHYSNLIYEENQWDKYYYLMAGLLSPEAFERIDYFFKVAQRVQEQQIYIKKKIQQSLDDKVTHYYNAIYSQVADLRIDVEQSKANINQIRDKFCKINTETYMQIEYANGLENALKRYRKLTDGNAYAELKKLKDKKV